MKPLRRLLVSICLLVCFSAHGQIITTVAGCGSCSALGDGGQATDASLSLFGSIALDRSGNIYIADGNHNRIRKVNASTGIITTVAGTGIAGFSGDNGPATNAQLNYAGVLALDTSDNLYIGDGYNYRVRKVDAITGIITTIAGTGSTGSVGDGGPATSASIDGGSMACDRFGNIYFYDGINYRIRKIDNANIISRIAGTGIEGSTGDGGAATLATIDCALGISTDNNGDIYISDNAASVRKITMSTGMINRIAGTGDTVCCPYAGDGLIATTVHISPFCVAFDAIGNMYIADYHNSRVEKVDLSGHIYSVAGIGTNGYNGDNIAATVAKLNYPEGVAVDKCGNVYVADYNNKRVRKIWFNPNCWPLAIDETQQNKPLTIYPNPATNTLHIDNLKAPATYTLYDITGRVVATSQLTTGPNEISTTHLSPGIYLLHLQHKDGTREVHKIVKD